MKSIAILLAILASSSAFAGSFVQGLPDGSYRGKFRGQEKGGVNFLVKGYPGCDGCFIAYKLNTPDFLGSQRVDMVAYSALPMQPEMVNGQMTSRRYSLTPIGVDAQGKLTLPNENPSLVLNILDGVGTQAATFTVTSAQSGNTLGGEESMAYLWSNESPFDIDSPISGEYREGGKSKTMATVSVVTENAEDHAHSARISWFGTIRKSGGDFLLKERIPYVYTFNAVSYLAEGEKTKTMPAFIIMFVKKGSKRWMLMVNPVDSRDVSRMILQ